MMKKENVLFFAKAAIAFFLVTGFVFGVVMPQYSQGYNASLIDKMARLKSLTGPKLVLIGNSNLPFGVDSEMLEDEFGVPVVNMGLHGGLGNAFHEQMARTNVQSGDLYVVVHTEYDDDDGIGNPDLVWITLENHWGLYRLLRPKDWGVVKDSFSTYFRKALALYVDRSGNAFSAEDPYNRHAFNKYGDNAFPRPCQSGDIIPFDEQTVSQASDACIDRLNELNAYLTARGATMLVALYPIAYGTYTPDTDEYYDLMETLTERLDCPVISYPADYMYDYEDFYDTFFHLTDNSVHRRTHQLIFDIRRWQEGGVPGEV